MHTQYLAVITV